MEAGETKKMAGVDVDYGVLLNTFVDSGPFQFVDGGQQWSTLGGGTDAFSSCAATC